MKAYVYILLDDNGRFYVGSTRSVDNRIQTHILKRSKYTSGLKNPKPVLIQEFESITIARKVENRIKKLKRKDYIRLIVKDGTIKLRP